MARPQEDVFLKENGWEQLRISVEKKQPSKIFVMVDNNTEGLCLPLLQKHFSPDFTSIVLPEGEEYKNIASCLEVWQKLSAHGADRQSLLINLGGGMITDLGGFVATTYQRGIPFINIPTTLLAMVDASVGGKNGVDLGYLKNQIGTVNMPKLVVLEPDFLNTLPQRELLSGFAEMLKHGLLKGEKSFGELLDVDLKNSPVFERLIFESVQIKNEIVWEDPLEKGKRKILNFGHTLGHAIESHCLKDKRPKLLHGEAIAIGMVLAAYLSYELVGLPERKLDKICQGINEYFPKQNFSDEEITEIVELLSFDKKNDRGKVLFVLMEDFGLFRTNCVVDNPLIHRAFEFYKNS